MKQAKRYITLENGRSVRVIWNEQLRSKVLEIYGSLSLDESQKGTTKFASDLLFMMVEAGEKEDGRTFELTQIELNRLAPLCIYIEFAKIAKELMAEFNGQKYKEKPPKVYFRN